jgi:dTDP-4-dehydrorhamnose reductase
MAMELWGGVECTVNRVGDRYFEQLARSGHEHRIDDLDRFASLGITAIRYPVLWERTAPDGLSRASWDWADRRLGRLAELGIKPIIGLVHHGSGPRDTSLVDPDFAPRLAEFAGAVARRYPWASAYTPVNEPLTTARFSGLYGHWYPHGKDDRVFLKALIVQCRAITLSMRAIRAETSGAQLVQTDDGGRTFSTPFLDYEAEFENHRRLLGFDLLTGRVTAAHPLWSYLLTYGVTEDEIAWFTDHRCPPDLIGLNYYLTSDRLLDERLERYPSWSHGGNRRHAYADISAVHAWKDGIVGFESCLSSLWERYGIPLAITEAHLGCTREEQLRWLAEAWEGAQAARATGADVRAVTVWSLLGAYDWNRLVTVEAGWYEPGVFDVRSTQPRPTALATMMAALASDGRYDHPLLANPGWWRRPTRLHFPWVGPEDGGNILSDSFAPRRAVRPQHPVVIVGANGTLGRALARLCTERAIECVALSRHDLDIADQHAVQQLVERLHPWAVINAAGYVRVDEAEADCDRCLRENTVGAERLATVCAQSGIRFLTYSSDLVFNGARAAPYLESHPVGPLNVYGRSKAEAERLVSQAMPSALIIRTSAFFGPWDSYNFVSNVLEGLMEGRSVRASKAVVSPTYVPDLVHASLDLMIDGEEGLWHVANQGAVSWTHLARTTATMAGLDHTLIEECHPHELGWSAERPGYSALGSERGLLLPLWEESLERYLHARRDEVARGRAGCV